MSSARARNLRRLTGRAERELWKLLRDRRLGGYKFRRQHPIDRYFADFACVSAMLIVEVDGPSHSIPEQQARDYRREVRLTELGWRVLHVTNDAVLADSSGTASTILAALEQSPSP